MHANKGRAADTTGAPPEVAPSVSEANAPQPNEFDWAATDYWVKEVKRRWTLAKGDAPEVNFPVLDAWALDLIDSSETQALEAGEDSIALEESAWLTESGVMLGELLVMPCETLFDEDEHVFTASALGLELDEVSTDNGASWSALEASAFVESGEVPLAFEAEVSRVEALAMEGMPEDVSASSFAAVEHEADPFIDELSLFVLREVNEAHAELAAPCGPTEAAAVSAASMDQATYHFSEARIVPRVAEGRPQAPAPFSELFVMPRGAQPLVPLQLELTPTPGGVSPWSELTAALARHLMHGGHTRAAALIGPLLCGELVDFSRLEPGAIERLTTDGVAEFRGGRVVATSTFRHAAKAFREEFATGGLDAGEALFWLSQLLVGLCGGGADESTLEEELRGLGIANLLEWAA